MLLKQPKGQLAKKFAKYIARDPKLRKVVAAVKKDFDKSGLTANNWEHIWRDILNAIVIGEGFGILPFKLIVHYKDTMLNPLSEVAPQLETVFLHEYETKVFYV